MLEIKPIGPTTAVGGRNYMLWTEGRKASKYIREIMDLVRSPIDLTFDL